MKVILLDYVYKQGVAGEVIDVADGFARNFLIPKGLAVKATAGELKRASKLREQATVKRAALENRMNELARAIDGVELLFERRAAITGKLFGSVTTQEIADSLLEKTGVDINRRRISQQGLRELGTHDVAVRLGNEMAPVLKVTVIQEGTMEEFLAEREAGEATEGDAGEATEGDAEASDDAVEGDADAGEMPTEVLAADEVRAEVEAIAEADTTEEDAPEADSDDA